jgi:hypothetical protein
MYLGKLNSVWGQKLTTTLSVSYNNKGGEDEDTYNNATGFGPRVAVHQNAVISQGRPTGSGELVTMNNVESRSLAPSSMMILRGDLTYYHAGGIGSHELKTGIWAAPRLWRDVTNRRSNDGFLLEEVRQLDPAILNENTVAFHRR